MRTPTYLLPLFLILPILSFGQTDFQNILFQNSIEFSAHTLLTPALNIERNYSGNENDLTSNNSFAFQGTLLRHLSIRSNFSAQMGIVGGTYSIHSRVKLTEEFRFIGWGGFDNYSVEYDLPYLGLNIGLNQILFAKGKNILSLGASVNVVYFVYSGFDFGVFAHTTMGENKQLFSTQFQIKNKDRLIVLPQIEIAYHRKLGTHFSFKTSFLAAYSNRKFLNSSYVLYGDNENITGSFSKKINHIGITVGLFYFLKTNTTD